MGFSTWSQKITGSLTRLILRGRTGGDSPEHTRIQEGTRDDGLLALPEELIEQIADHLSFSEAACLSLCNKRLCRQLGTKARWEHLRPGQGHDEHRQEFLELLASQHPTVYYCHTCSYLHLVSRVGPALENSAIRDRALAHSRPHCIDDLGSHHAPFQLFETYNGQSSYDLTFSHVQLVLAGHRRGSAWGIPLSFLSLKEVSVENGIVSLLDIEPRIINEGLFVRVQQWTVFDLDHPPSLTKYDGRPSICRHIDTATSTLVLRKLEAAVRHARAQTSVATDSVLRRCTRCTVEFEMDERSLDDGKRAVVVTKWLNLGGGKSLMDPAWQQLLRQRSYGSDRNVARGPNQVSSRAAFEQQAQRSYDRALHENAALLAADAYKSRLQTCGSSEVWLDR